MVIITNLDGKTLPLVDVEFLHRTRGTNGDHEIFMVANETDRNTRSFNLVDHESIIELPDGNTFRIKKLDKEIVNNVQRVELTARHTFYDTVGNYQYEIIEGEKVLSLHQLLSHAFEGTDITFTIHDDFDNYSFENFGNANSIKLFNDIKDNIPFEFNISNNTHLEIYKQIGSTDKNLQMRYKQNIVTIKKEDNTENLATEIKGFGKPKEDAEGNQIEGEYEVEITYTSPNAERYGVIVADPYYNEKITHEPTMLRYLQNAIVDEPEVTFTITYEEMIKNVNKELDAAELGDQIELIHEKMDLAFPTRILEVTDYPLNKNLKPIYTISTTYLNKLDKQTSAIIDNKNLKDEMAESHRRHDELFQRVEKAREAVADVENAMIHVDEEMARLENEVIPEIEQAVDSAKIPSQVEPPYPIPTSNLWWDTSINPPRLMRYDGTEWVILAPTEDEIDDLMQQWIDEAKQENIEYTDAEIAIIKTAITNRIEKEIGDVNSNIDDLESTANSLVDRANATDDLLDAHDGKFTSFDREIDEIEGKLTTNITDIERIDGTVSGHSTELTTQAGLISAKLDSSTYQTDKTEILSSIESNSAEINAMSDQIELRVTKEEFENLGFGGKNLLLDTNNFLDGENWTAHGGASFYNHISIDFAATGETFVRQSLRNLQDGENYILQLVPNADLTKKIDVWLADGSIILFHKVFDFEGNANKVLTANIPNLNVPSNNLVFFNIGYMANTTISDSDRNWRTPIRDIQLERGSVRTDYRPSPDDAVEVDLSGIEERITSTEATLDIHAEAIELSATKSDLLNYVDKQSYTNQMGDLTVSIEDITGRVEKTEADIGNVTGNYTSFQQDYAEFVTEMDNFTTRVGHLSDDGDTLVEQLSEVVQESGRIVSRVEGVEVAVEGFEDEMTTFSTEIEQLPGNINLAVSKGIGDLGIGGRNLLGNSKKPKLSSNNNTTTPLKITEFDDYIRYEPLDGAGLSTYSTLNSSTHPIYDKDWLGKDMVVSMAVRVSKDVRLRFRFSDRGRSSTTIKQEFFNVKSSDGWTRLAITVPKDLINKNPDTDTIRFLLYTVDNSGTIIDYTGEYVDSKEWKIAFGTKDDGWSETPEEQVNKTNVLSSINLSTEGIEIEASKVDIRGLVSFINSDGDSRTLINGGKIAARTITANQLRVDQIFTNSAVIDVIQAASVKTAELQAEKITSGILNAARIGANSITAGKIAAGAITTQKIAAAGIDAGVIKSGKIDAIDIVGSTISGGRLQALNNNTNFDLNTGNLTMQNTDFTLGGGASIEFTSIGNRMFYNRNNRRAGYGVGRSINDTYPYVFMGTSGLNQSLDPSDTARFSGFISNTRQRTTVDGIGNSAVGLIFQVRDEAVSYNKGFEFDLQGSNNFRMRPISAGSQDYWLGATDNQFAGIYTRQMRTSNGFFRFQNSASQYSSQGFRMDTTYDGDDQMYFRGINSNDYHSLGRSGSWRFRYVYLRYQPDVSSDIRMKTGIRELDKASEIIDALQPIEYRYKLSNTDLELKNSGNMERGLNTKQYGFSAQHTKQVLDDLGIEDQSLVNLGEDNYYGMQTTQVIPLLVKAFQEEKQRNENLELRLEILESQMEQLLA